MIDETTMSDTTVLPDPTPEELAEIARMESEVEAARIAEDERRVRVRAQTPNLLRLMRQRWHGASDPAILAVFDACEPEAYQNARMAFDIEIAEYNRMTGEKGGKAHRGDMPPAEQSSKQATVRKVRR